MQRNPLIVEGSSADFDALRQLESRAEVIRGMARAAVESGRLHPPSSQYYPVSIDCQRSDVFTESVILTPLDPKTHKVSDKWAPSRYLQQIDNPETDTTVVKSMLFAPDDTVASVERRTYRAGHLQESISAEKLRALRYAKDDIVKRIGSLLIVPVAPSASEVSQRLFAHVRYTDRVLTRPTEDFATNYRVQHSLDWVYRPSKPTEEPADGPNLAIGQDIVIGSLTNGQEVITEEDWYETLRLPTQEVGGRVVLGLQESVDGLWNARVSVGQGLTGEEVWSQKSKNPDSVALEKENKQLRIVSHLDHPGDIDIVVPHTMRFGEAWAQLLF